MRKSTHELEREIKELRTLLWLKHGCDHPALYGNDGEMQCKKCMIDFKRDSIQFICQKFYKIGLGKINKLKETMKEVFSLEGTASEN